jgi:tRNA threonylcarbamoyladenosine biosynthesis protein TsaB
VEELMELSIDTASDLASVALSREGAVVDEITWKCARNHTVELLPATGRLLTRANVTKAELTAVFVTTGPGMYTGLRVGIATAKGLARALGLPLVGVGRLELDAYPHAAFSGAIVAVHRAGRGDLAWASHAGNPWRELTPPQLSKPEELARLLSTPALVVGEVDDALRAALAGAPGITCVEGDEASGRARALAALGYERLAGGAASEPALLRPVYLRPPAIGPQQK